VTLPGNYKPDEVVLPASNMIISVFEINQTASMLHPQTIAPDFMLYATPEHTVRLSDFTSQKVILAFYKADWYQKSAEQLVVFNEMEKYFAGHNAQLIGISVDSKWSHAAFSRKHHLYFPLLADFAPKGEISRLYEVYDEVEQLSNTALYVLDERRVISWCHFSKDGVNPGANSVLSALELLDHSKSKIS
jgi:peroxiredoxin